MLALPPVSGGLSISTTASSSVSDLGSAGDTTMAGVIAAFMATTTIVDMPMVVLNGDTAEDPDTVVVDAVADPDMVVVDAPVVDPDTVVEAMPVVVDTLVVEAMPVVGTPVVDMLVVDTLVVWATVNTDKKHRGQRKLSPILCAGCSASCNSQRSIAIGSIIP